MSNAISVLNGASSEGLNIIKDAGLKSMITVKGDITSAEMKAAIKSVVGLEPPAPGAVKTGSKGSVAWMAPDELLLICAYEKADTLIASLDVALENTHSLVVNVSDARAIFSIEGTQIRNVLAKGTPTPLDDFGKGSFRRSRLGQIPSAFWLETEELGYVVCFRSVGKHMFDWLSNANNVDSPLELY